MEVSGTCGRIVSVCPDSPMIVVSMCAVVVVAGPAMPTVGEARTAGIVTVIVDMLGVICGLRRKRSRVDG